MSRYIPYLLELIILAPLIWLLVYSFLVPFVKKLNENIPIIAIKILGILILSINGILLFYLINNNVSSITLNLGQWFSVADYNFLFEIKYNYESIALSFMAMLLISVITKFSETYLHKENGYHRFFLLLSLFICGYNIVLVSNNIDLFFMGWEMIGSTSVLLIAFYYERESAVKNSFWAIASYRLCDIFILVGSSLAHFLLHTSNFDEINTHIIEGVHGAYGGSEFIFLGILFICGSLAKSGQFPMVSWLIRAMEGPTPSSALYYGALSVSLGPVLILKFYPFIMHFWQLRLFLILIGVITFPFAIMISKSKSDAKSILAFSSVMQLSLIFIELGLGLKWLALFHLISNAFVRIYQFLRSLNTISDFYENPMFFRGSILETKSPEFFFLTKKMQNRLYYMSINGFGLDALLTRFIVGPWMSMLKFFNEIEEELTTKTKQEEVDKRFSEHEEEMRSL